MLAVAKAAAPSEGDVMRTMKSDPHAVPAGLPEEETEVDAGPEAEAEAEGDVVRIACPDCRQPVALAAEALALPVHALCPTPWDPFGITVCPGSGRTVADGAGPPPVPASPAGGQSAARPTLPEGLDWRLQPFSHAAVRQAA
jgi:hypothetical protein